MRTKLLNLALKKLGGRRSGWGPTLTVALLGLGVAGGGDVAQARLVRCLRLRGGVDSDHFAGVEILRHRVGDRGGAVAVSAHRGRPLRDSQVALARGRKTNATRSFNRGLCVTKRVQHTRGIVLRPGCFRQLTTLNTRAAAATAAATQVFPIKECDGGRKKGRGFRNLTNCAPCRSNAGDGHL